MSTETVPPSAADDLPTTAPPATPATDTDQEVEARAGHTDPVVDVPALTALLDGRYADVRNLVRANLAEYSSILSDAETMTHREFRERVKDVVVEMAATGQTGM